jgi:hypothetical protein
VLTTARRQEGARLEVARRVNTYIPENIRFVLPSAPTSSPRPSTVTQLRIDLRN